MIFFVVFRLWFILYFYETSRTVLPYDRFYLHWHIKMCFQHNDPKFRRDIFGSYLGKG